MPTQANVQTAPHRARRSNSRLTCPLLSQVPREPEPRLGDRSALQPPFHRERRGPKHQAGRGVGVRGTGRGDALPPWETFHGTFRTRSQTRVLVRQQNSERLLWFQLTLVCENNLFRMVVNGKQAHTYKHRFTPVHHVNTLEIDGDLHLSSVSL